MTRFATLVSVLGVIAWSGSALAGDDQPPKPQAKPAAQPPGPGQAARDDIKATLGFVPGFLKDMPDSALPGAWEEMKTIQMNPKTALPPKIKELIGLAVSAQVPCTYCIYAHTQFAKLNGATDAEIKEAVVVGAQTRHWSTVAQGFQQDLAKWNAEIAIAIAHQKKMAAGQVPPPKPIQVVDAQSALQDIQQSFGTVPEFLRRFPPEGLAGAWKEMRDTVFNPNTAIPARYKTLIGIAVASQVPCRYCLAADTQFAKLEGSSERDIAEAIAMAAITRHWSTYLNGTQTDLAAFKRDIDRLVRDAKKQAAKPPVAAAPAQPAAPHASAAAAKPAPLQ